MKKKKKKPVKAKKKKATKSKVKTAKKAKPSKAAKKKASAPKKKAAPKKTAKKKSAKKKASTPPKSVIMAPPNSVLLGRVEDFFAKINVITLTLQQPMSLGARLHILGHTTNFEQTLDSMQIDHQTVTEARAGDGIGIKVTARARAGDHVYLILS